MDKMYGWKRMFENLSEGSDRYERECIAKENQKRFMSNVDDLADKLRLLYDKYLEYKELKNTFEFYGFKIKECPNDKKVKIYKEL